MNVNEPFVFITIVPSVGATATVKTEPGATESFEATVAEAAEPAVLVSVSSCRTGAGGAGLIETETLADAEAQVLWLGEGRQTV